VVALSLFFSLAHNLRHQTVFEFFDLVFTAVWENKLFSTDGFDAKNLNLLLDE